MTNLHPAIANLIDQRAQLVTVMLEKFTDKSIALQDRWELFSQMSHHDLLSDGGYGDGYIDLLGEDLNMYDNFNCDRYATLKYCDMFDRFHGQDFLSENIEAWMEAVLEAGFQSFTYDW